MSELNAGHLQKYRQKPKWQEGRKSDLGFPVPYWSHITLSPILTSGTSVNPLAALKPSRRLLFLHCCVWLENNQALFLFNLLSAQLICTEPLSPSSPPPGLQFLLEVWKRLPAAGSKRQRKIPPISYYQYLNLVGSVKWEGEILHQHGKLEILDFQCVLLLAPSCTEIFCMTVFCTSQLGSNWFKTEKPTGRRWLHLASFRS